MMGAVWPPPPVDIPPIVCDPSAFDGLVEGLRGTIGALVGTGMQLLVIILSITSIVMIFRFVLGSIPMGGSKGGGGSLFHQDSSESSLFFGGRRGKK